jgi:hypothetical protein
MVSKTYTAVIWRDMTDYVDRCLCGYFVTQQEVNSGKCPECNRGIFNLDDAWISWEEKEIAETTTVHTSELTTARQTTSVNSPNTGGIH